MLTSCNCLLKLHFIPQPWSSQLTAVSGLTRLVHPVEVLRGRKQGNVRVIRNEGIFILTHRKRYAYFIEDSNDLKKRDYFHVQYDISENLYIVLHLVIRAARN